MTAPEPHILRRAARAAIDVDRTGAAARVPPDAPLAVRIEGEDATWFAFAHPADEDGDALLTFAKGLTGLRHVRDVADARRDAACERAVELLEVAFVPLHVLPPAERAALQRAGVLLDSGEIAPSFSVKRRNRSRAAPDRRDLRRVELLLVAVLARAASPDAETPPGELATATWTDADGGGFALTSERHADDLGRTDAPVRCSSDSEAWPVATGRWAVGVFDVPSRAPGRETGRILVAVDAESGRRLGAVTAVRDDARSFARALVRGLWCGDPEPAFPAEMTVVGSALRDAVAEALEPRGVHVSVTESDPVLDEAVADFRRVVETAGSPDVVETWLDAGDELDALLVDRFREAFPHADAAQWFFGPWSPDVEGDEDEIDYELALASLDEWGAFVWRRTDGAPTVAERTLADLEDGPARTLLEARIVAQPSLWFVVRADPREGTLDVEDAFTGETVTVHDETLAASALEGHVLALRVAAAGPFHVARAAGPQFPAEDLDEALEEIARTGAPPTREGLRDHPHVLGRLWPWAWDRRPVTEEEDAGESDADDADARDDDADRRGD